MPFSPIQDGKHHIQYSDTPGETIRAAGLKAGEIAINTADAKMYLRAAGGNLLTFDGAVAPQGDAIDLSILKEYMNSKMLPAVGDASPVLSDITNWGLPDIVATTLYACSLPGGKVAVVHGDRTNDTVKLYIIDTDTGTHVFVKDLPGVTGSGAFIGYDAETALLVYFVPGGSNKIQAVTTDGSREYTFGQAPANIWGWVWNGLYLAISSATDYRTGQPVDFAGRESELVLLDRSLLRSRLEGSDQVFTIYGRDLNVKHSFAIPIGLGSLWPCKRVACMGGDMASVFLREDSEHVFYRVSLETESLTGTYSGLPEHALLASLADGGAVSMTSAGVRRLRPGGTVDAAVAFTGDVSDMVNLKAFCYLPDGRVLVQKGVSGGYKLAAATVHSSVGSLLEDSDMLGSGCGVDVRWAARYTN
jgi:hypothetical protein